jgi:sec-independent protein translocase protein TatA
MPNIGPLEIAVVLIIVLIIFGPKRLPELGQSMGRGIREFRSSISGGKNDEDDADERRELETARTAEPRSQGAAGDSKPAGEQAEGEVVTDNKA